MFLHHYNLSIRDREESFNAPPSGAVAGGCPKGEAISSPKFFIVWFIMSASTMESRLCRGGKDRVTHTTTVPIGVKLDHAVVPEVMHNTSLRAKSIIGGGGATLCVQTVAIALSWMSRRMLIRSLITAYGTLVEGLTRPWVSGLADAKAAKH